MNQTHILLCSCNALDKFFPDDEKKVIKNVRWSWLSHSNFYSSFKWKITQLPELTDYEWILFCFGFCIEQFWVKSHHFGLFHEPLPTNYRSRIKSSESLWFLRFVYLSMQFNIRFRSFTFSWYCIHRAMCVTRTERETVVSN